MSNLPTHRSTHLVSDMNADVINPSPIATTRSLGMASLHVPWGAGRILKKIDRRDFNEMCETRSEARRELDRDAVAANVRVQKELIEHRENYEKRMMRVRGMEVSDKIDTHVAAVIDESTKRANETFRGRVLDAYTNETMWEAKAKDLYASGQISERRCQQFLAHTPANTDEQVQEYHWTHHILGEHRARNFKSAL